MSDELESFRSQEIAFIGEQDGEAEGALKAKLVVRFQSDIHVNEAYLVRVRYKSDSVPKVALCIEAGDQVRSVIIEAIASEFRNMFRTDAALDILFLSREQQGRIASVARPFYKQHAYRA
jgi:hypothetical protein